MVHAASYITCGMCLLQIILPLLCMYVLSLGATILHETDCTMQAIALDKSAALPHIAACTSMGRLALLSDNKKKVSLAHDARQEAVLALELEPSNDLAHHLMGRWHSEMANLNMVVRTLVRVMYGTSLAPGAPELPHFCFTGMYLLMKQVLIVDRWTSILSRIVFLVNIAHCTVVLYDSNKCLQSQTSVCTVRSICPWWKHQWSACCDLTFDHVCGCHRQSPRCFGQLSEGCNFGSWAVDSQG